VLEVRIVCLPHYGNFPLPRYETPGSAGVDLRYAGEYPVVLAPGKSWVFPTGLKMAIPQGWEGQIRPRSGIAFRNQVTVTNSPGTVDSDYRGEVKVLLINHGEEVFRVEPGDRVAQMVFAPVVQASFYLTDSLDETERGDGGFGSTGVSE